MSPDPRAWWRRIFKMMDGINGATIGFLFYGSWGAYANSAHGTGIALRSGLAQGSMSFVVTLTGVILMRSLFRLPGPVVWRASVAAVGALATIYGGIIGVHLWLGTPEILLTLLPGLPITIGFCVAFSVGLAKLEGPALELPADSRRPLCPPHA